MILITPNATINTNNIKYITHDDAAIYVDSTLNIFECTNNYTILCEVYDKIIYSWTSGMKTLNLSKTVKEITNRYYGLYNYSETIK